MESRARRRSAIVDTKPSRPVRFVGSMVGKAAGRLQTPGISRRPKRLDHEHIVFSDVAKRVDLQTELIRIWVITNGEHEEPVDSWSHYESEDGAVLVDADNSPASHRENVLGIECDIEMPDRTVAHATFVQTQDKHYSLSVDYIDPSKKGKDGSKVRLLRKMPVRDYDIVRKMLDVVASRINPSATSQPAL